MYLQSLLYLVFAGTALASSCQGKTFDNPVIYSDFPDNDVFVGPDGDYYFSASNFHYSPGAPILRSKDLVNWDLIGHSIPRLTFGEGYDLPPGGAHSYRGGTWASTLRYRKSNGLWYWIGCTNFWITWVFTAPEATGPWTLRGNYGGGICFYDNGLLIDDQDTMYVVHGSNNVRVAQLSADGLSAVKIQSVLNNTDVGADGLEGNRMYQINGLYYILNDRPGGTTYIWKSESPWGPYESKILVDSVTPPIEGGSSPHQGSLIQTPEGAYYYMSFTWAYPAGRLPVLAPLEWGSDGYPTFVTGENGGWGESYPLPYAASNVPAKNWTRTDRFTGTSLDPSWEWNHNPDVASYSVNNGLTLRTATVTNNVHLARNTLTHRTHGEFPQGTVVIDFSNMARGDRAGLATFRDQSSYIGIHREGDEWNLVAFYGAVINEWSGATEELGSTVASISIPSARRRVWLRVNMDARPNGKRTAVFQYSWDGVAFQVLGPTYELYGGWAFFIAYRFGIFNFATEALGGSVSVESFTAA